MGWFTRKEWRRIAAIYVVGFLIASVVMVILQVTWERQLTIDTILTVLYALLSGAVGRFHRGPKAACAALSRMSSLAPRGRRLARGFATAQSKFMSGVPPPAHVTSIGLSPYLDDVGGWVVEMRREGDVALDGMWGPTKRDLKSSLEKLRIAHLSLEGAYESYGKVQIRAEDGAPPVRAAISKVAYTVREFETAVLTAKREWCGTD